MAKNDKSTTPSPLIEALKERANSYRQSGPSAEHTANLLDRAALMIESLALRIATETTDSLATPAPPPTDAEGMRESKEFWADAIEREGNHDILVGGSGRPIEHPIVKELRDQAAARTKTADNPFEDRKETIEWKAADFIEALPTPAREIDREKLASFMWDKRMEIHGTIENPLEKQPEEIRSWLLQEADAILSLIGGRHG